MGGGFDVSCIFVLWCFVLGWVWGSGWGGVLWWRGDEGGGGGGGWRGGGREIKVSV